MTIKTQTTPKTKAKRAKTAAVAAGAKTPAKHTGTITALVPVAKEINHRFKQATKLDGQADDHRLAAAIQLAEAKVKCEGVAMNFKRWAEENIVQSYETIRKLAAVGAADDPKLALEDMRGKNKVANKKHRDATVRVSRDTTEEAASVAPTAPLSPFARADAALEQLEDTVRLNVIASAAGDLGMNVVPEADYDKLRADSKKLAQKMTLVNLKAAFDKMGKPQQIDFLEYAADVLSATVDIDFETVDVQHGADSLELDLDKLMPDALRADLKKKKAA